MDEQRFTDLEDSPIRPKGVGKVTITGTAGNAGPIHFATGDTLEFNTGTGGVPHWGTGVINTPWPGPVAENISEEKEIDVREASIDYTIQMFGNNPDVGIELFAKTLDAVYDFIRYGKRIKINEKTQTI